MVEEQKHHQVIPELVYRYNVRVMAEIGVHRGRGMRRILRSSVSSQLREYWAIDPWAVCGPEHGAKYAGWDQDTWDEFYYGVVRYMLYFNQLKVLRLTSVEASKLFWDGYFDMVFIDASHFFDDVVEDIGVWLPKVKPGGILSGHDYGLGYKKGHRVKEAVEACFGEGSVAVYDDGVWVKEL